MVVHETEKNLQMGREKNARQPVCVCVCVYVSVWLTIGN
jgi:hypothetical protein